MRLLLVGAALGTQPSEGFVPLKKPVRGRGSRLQMARSNSGQGRPFDLTPNGPQDPNAPPLPGQGMPIPGDSDWGDNDDPFGAGGGGGAGGRGGGGASRFQQMMQQAEQKTAFENSKDEWEPLSGLAEEQRAEAEKRDREAREQAKADGYDPEDEESMRVAETIASRPTRIVPGVEGIR